MRADVKQLQQDWAENPRWRSVQRDYSAEDVVRLRGSVHIEHTLARRGAEKLWRLVNDEEYIHCLGAVTGGQAVQQVKAGVKAIYLSGWQVAADGNTSETMYPDQSLYAWTPCRRWYAGSTTRSNVPMRSSVREVMVILISSPPLSQTPKRVLAAS